MISHFTKQRVWLASKKYAKPIIISITTLIALIGLKKTYDFAAPPQKEKDCDYKFPRESDPTKPTTISVDDSLTITLLQKGGTINDASCLNKTNVYGVASIETIDDVSKALQFAQKNDLKVTSAGQKHSMGGQAFSRGGLVLDMRTFNKMSLNETKEVLTVESGATWEQIQKFLDPQGLSIQAMQSINIFTVGGTLSVNAHGIAHNPGQVAPTIESLRVMLADGTVRRASRTENPELFKAVLGGYGLFGVILDVNIKLTKNEAYEWKTVPMNYKDFPSYFKNNIQNNEDIGLMYGRISLSPTAYMTDTVVHEYHKVPATIAPAPLETVGQDWMNRLIINFSKTGGIGRWVRWNIEKYAGSRLHKCISRNQAMVDTEGCVVSRNQEMYDAMGYLKNRLPDTDILQEYFIPHENMPAFIDGLREIVQTNDANLLNITIRIVTKDTDTMIPYAPEDRFAFVLYFNQKFSDKESEKLKQTTLDLIDLSTKLGGRYYLPYQLYYSQEQLRAAYPEIDRFFALKKQYDPSELFSNHFYEKYRTKK